MNRLEGKVAIVTGAGRGMGRATAELFAKEGAKVAIFARGDNGLETEKAILDAGGEAKFWRVDVAVEAQVEQAVNEVVEKWGRVDVLVNNAGLQSVDKMMHEITEEEWKSVFDVDVHGVFFCSKHVVRDMLKHHSGSIINISSIQGLAGSYDELNFPYHACKAAVFGMTRQDACIYGPYGIRVNSIHPAAIDTPMVRNRLGDEETFNRLMTEWAKAYPLRTYGHVDDIAYACLYLASDESKFVTGVQLPVDGGYLAY